MSYSSISFLTAFFLFSSSRLLSAPVITFESKSVDCGVVIPEKTEKLYAVFNFKNTGDAPLILEQVKPGCGCTVVQYDTLIPPGKAAKISAQVNIKGYHSGPLSKSINVKSNAANEPSVRLMIKAGLESVIELSDRYVSLDATHKQVPRRINVTSKKADLKVIDISFVMENPSSGTAGWQADLPIAVKFHWAPSDSIRTDKLHVYNLDIFSPEVEKTVSGQFIIRTNHPEEPQMTLHGRIQQ